MVYSRLQRIRNLNKRRQKRKIIGLFTAPFVFVFVVFWYVSMAPLEKNTTDQKEKTASHFAPDGASRDKEVAGEKTQETRITPTVNPMPSESIQQPSVAPDSKPTLSPSPTEIAAIAPPTNTPIPLPTPTPDIFSIPSYLTKYMGSNTISVNQGTIAFNVVADWKGDGQILFRGNFNGIDRKNLIEIEGRGNWITFVIYNDMGDGESSDKQYVNIGDDYFGKTFNVVETWDFRGDIIIKRIYINGGLRREDMIDPFPMDINAQIFIGKITDLKISDKWEDR